MPAITEAVFFSCMAVAGLLGGLAVAVVAGLAERIGRKRETIQWEGDDDEQ